MASFLDISVEEKEYSIGWTKFKSEATNPFLLEGTQQVLNAFRQLEWTINKQKSIDIDKDTCNEQLATLARWGQRTYQKFFDARAQEILRARFQMMKATNAGTPAPTFISDMVSFPWEVLYEGDADDVIDWKQFWGLGYAPARILDKRDIAQYVWEQTLPSDMLFCLHHKLRYTHQREWPEIEKLVRITTQDHFSVLGCHSSVRPIATGKDLFTYFAETSHNMLHFACHCKQHNTEADVLQLSLLNEEGVAVDALEIELSTYTFLDVKKRFKGFVRQPLIFLNACKTAGGADALRNTFNLPEEFIKCGAAAVIATACAVPDLFAAAFARQFYKFFLQEHMTIGEALQATRWYFLEYHNNPLGLAYGLYSPAHYRLAQPIVGGIAS
jgi:hypothetical protein